MSLGVDRERAEAALRYAPTAQNPIQQRIEITGTIWVHFTKLYGGCAVLSLISPCMLRPALAYSVLRTCYAMSGTGVGYAVRTTTSVRTLVVVDTQCPVLT
eukprot:3119150-Rhodomonas_salina.1